MTYIQANISRDCSRGRNKQQAKSKFDFSSLHVDYFSFFTGSQTTTMVTEIEKVLDQRPLIWTKIILDSIAFNINLILRMKLHP